VVELSELVREEEIREALKNIVAHEEEKLERYRKDPFYQGFDPWWEWHEIPVAPHLIRKLLLAGVVRALGGRRKEYVLHDREAVKRALEEYEAYERIQEAESGLEESAEVPADLFDVVEGYDDLKEFIKLSLRAEEPVHCLLVGPPGTAKSLILMELERLGGSRFITAGTMTKVGLRDVIYEELPPILIIDELDKLTDQRDVSSLLTWMESGRIIVTKHGMRDERRGRGRVFAACNSLKGLPPELVDRFQVFHIRPYSPEQFVRVVRGYLTKRMKIGEELAAYIAERVREYTVSVREAIRIARLAKSKAEVDRIVDIIRRYKTYD